MVSRQSYIEPERCALRAGTSPEWMRHCKHTPVIFVCSIPSLPTARLNSEPSVSTTALPVSRWKSDTEETSKQRKLNRGNRLGSDPTQPANTRERARYTFTTFILFFFFFELMGLRDCFFFFFFVFPLFFNFLKFLSTRFL